MKTTPYTPVLLALTVLVMGACSTIKSTTLLDQTRADYQVAQSNPKIATYAQLEMKQAGDALGLANVAATKNESVENIDKLAYLAKQKIALTQEVAKQKSAEADVAGAGKERDQMRLQQRTEEANESKFVARVAMGDAVESRERTAKLEAELTALKAKKTERGMVITLGDVLFGTNLSRVNPEGRNTLQKLAEMLNQNPQRTVLIEGFADSRGTEEHNQTLSEHRADAVGKALQDMGISGARVTTQGYGEGYPIAANDSKAHQQLNRRVEVIISNESGKIPAR
jgi:outer membrane protein OmpA-like peptidoglycan-associated protein